MIQNTLVWLSMNQYNLVYLILQMKGTKSKGSQLQVLSHVKLVCRYSNWI